MACVLSIELSFVIFQTFKIFIKRNVLLNLLKEHREKREDIYGRISYKKEKEM